MRTEFECRIHSFPVIRIKTTGRRFESIFSGASMICKCVNCCDGGFVCTVCFCWDTFPSRRDLLPLKTDIRVSLKWKARIFPSTGLCHHSRRIAVRWLGTDGRDGERRTACGGRGLTDLSGILADGPVNYKYKTKCTWLIEGYPNAVLRLRFNHFATECSWDHMYVYDGDSIYAPLIAVFSGLVVPETRGNETVPEVVTTSGYALLHFFSDAAYNLTGFSIAYSMNSCPNNCSGHGRCSTANSPSGRVYCECEEYWKGEACDVPYCRDDCGSPGRGYCDLTGEKLCVCNDSWQGPDCSLSVPSTEAFWVLPSVKPSAQSLGRASHQALVHSGLMWVVGGYSFNYSNYHMVLNYNLDSGAWDVVPVSSGPLYRYGHSLALHQDDIYMFGGKLEAKSANVTDEMWVFNIPRRTWSPRKPAPPPPYALEGHSAHVVELASGEQVMLVFFGYSPTYGYINKVQEYNIGSDSWQVVPAEGAVVQGGYGHSSAYDEAGGCVFVHGGYKPLSNKKHGLVDHMYRYHVRTKTWLILRESGVARYLHSAVLVSGAVLVFGGNTHNDTSLSNGAKCFSADFLAYDTACDGWTALPRPALHRDANRFGHSAVVSNGSMFVFGGFSGLLLNDVLAYTPPSCRAFSQPAACGAAGPGLRCHWVGSRCDPWQPKAAEHSVPAHFCPPRPDGTDERCFRFSDCASCTANTWGCQWCEDRKCMSASSNCTVLTLELAQRQHGGALSLSRPPTMLSEHQLSLWKHGARRRGHSVRGAAGCKRRDEQECFRLANCRSCSLHANCQWEAQQQECQALPGQLCGEGWHHVGEACLRINSSSESYDNAQHYCKNLGGNIASLLTDKQVNFVLEELQKHQLADKALSPWVGLRKINVSYWGWEDASPFTNTSLRWLPGEPSDAGFCAYLERAQRAGLRANPCTAIADGLICEKPAGSPQSQSARPCRTPCSLRAGCANCTSQAMECMWCGSTQRCVDSSAYVISFPYGQCLEWQTQDCAAQNCSGLRTCSECLERTECGWCGDPSNTGRGVCMEGSYRGPMKPSGSRAGPPDRLRDRDMALDQSLCSSDRGSNWAFVQCPACQCNGHSRCVNGSVCEHCGNLTAGMHCQSCMAGYYGDPTNGGRCNGCKCNSHANVCHVHTGKCFCTTKGIKGDQCQLCDSENRYLGNPLWGTCYYRFLAAQQHHGPGAVLRHLLQLLPVSVTGRCRGLEGQTDLLGLTPSRAADERAPADGQSSLRLGKRSAGGGRRPRGAFTGAAQARRHGAMLGQQSGCPDRAALPAPSPVWHSSPRTVRHRYCQCSGRHITTASDGLQGKRPWSEAPKKHCASPRNLCINRNPSTVVTTAGVFMDFRLRDPL
ncbi:attractin-like protein 1 isoform 5-T5 [Spinachia spinachia]